MFFSENCKRDRPEGGTALLETNRCHTNKTRSSKTRSQVGKKTKCVMRREGLPRLRDTLESNSFCAYSRRLIGTEGTIATSSRRTRGYHVFRLLFWRWAMLYTQTGTVLTTTSTIQDNKIKPLQLYRPSGNYHRKNGRSDS